MAALPDGQVLADLGAVDPGHHEDGAWQRPAVLLAADDVSLPLERPHHDAGAGERQAVGGADLAHGRP